MDVVTHWTKDKEGVMKRLGLTFAVALAFFGVTYCNAQTSVTVPIETIDSTTHIAVQATVEFKGPESRSVQTDKDGRASVSLSPGKYQETITAPGYKTTTFPWVIHPNPSENVTRAGAMLDPVNEPEELALANAQIRPGYTVVAGYAVDEHNQPVADVRIGLQGKSVAPVEATTSYKGFFLIEVPSPPGTQDPNGRPGRDFLPGTANLTAEKSGYKNQVYTNIPLMSAQPSGVLINMQRGSGTVETDEEPAWMNGTGGNCIGEHACDDIDKTPNHLKAKPGEAAPVSPRSNTGSPKSGKAPVSLGSIIPPGTKIKVGYPCPATACSPTSATCPCSKFPKGCPICSQACTPLPNPISLETYVQQGLQNEWSNSWGPPNGPLDGDEAGAVAYRTFGYYRVQHPRSGSYDIRSDTCDQGFDPTKPAQGNTQAAAIDTAGIAMSDDGVTAYLASYRSVTNQAPGSGCLDGQTGDGANWLCMNDPIQTGASNNGGGQGMSQWGSWEWASGDSYVGTAVLAPGWQCILDHYYNDNGNATGKGGHLTYRYSFLYGNGGDGKVAFTVYPYGGSGQSALYTMNMDGSAPFQVIEASYGPSGPTWSPDQKTLAFGMGPYANIFTTSASGGGTPVQITFGSPLTWYGYPNWSRSGNNLLALYGANVNTGDEEIYSINASLPGQPTQLTFDFPLSDRLGPFWAPDGYHLAFQQDNWYCYGFCSYLVASANGSQQYRLYSAPLNTYTGDPGWSPDGSTIVFYAPNPSCGGAQGIYSVSDLGGTPTPLLCLSSGDFWSPRYSQDGRYIVSLFSYYYSNYATPYIMNKDGSGGGPLGSLQSYSQYYQSLDATRCMRLDILQPAE